MPALMRASISASVSAPASAPVSASIPVSRSAPEHRAASYLASLTLACLLAPALSFAAEPAASTGGGCMISEFRSGALLTHAPDERKAFAVAWLKKNADLCSIAQLKAIVANRPTWLGTADTGDVAQLLDSVLERRTGGNTDQFSSPVLPTPRPGSTGTGQGTATPPAAGPRPILAQPPGTPPNPATAAAPPQGNPQQPAMQKPALPAAAR